jgi:trehalose 6-phosphate synthase
MGQFIVKAPLSPFDRMAQAPVTVLTGPVKKQPPAPNSWDEHSFRAWVHDVFHGDSLVILASGEPPACNHTIGATGGVHGSFSGLDAALEPLTNSCSVVWIAGGDGEPPSGGMVHRYDESRARPAHPRLRRRRVSLTPQVEQGSYHRFCHEGLWPLCHRTSVRPTFRDHDFQMYSYANAQGVSAVCEELTSHSPVVLVQNHHFALAPKMIRARIPHAALVTYWPVPFPSPGTLSACPWERELIEGLLGSSIVGFQTAEDSRNFLDAAVCILGAYIDCDEHFVSYGDLRTRVHVYPASVDWPSRWALQSPPVEICRATVGQRFGLTPDIRLIVGIDGLDYTKGLVQKLLAFERLLITRPEFRGKAVLLQVAEPSQSALPAYRDYRTQVHQTADRINQRLSIGGCQPIVLLEQQMDKKDVFELFRASDVCYVGSLHDGMNLVSKEFVTARDDERGVLVLSEFAGAARELNEALPINPYMTDDCAKTLVDALNMPTTEQVKRMRALRAVVKRNNSYKCVGDMLADAASVRGQFQTNRRARGRVASRMSATAM